jgi:7-alpha-hydroxysteroid dehydrogenase
VANIVRGYLPKPFLGTTDEDLRDSFDLDVVYGLGLVRACVPHLAESDGAGVVMISSAIGHVTGRGWVAYGTAKAALEHAVRLMAADLNPGIRVNAVAPGAIMTDALSGFADDSDLIDGLKSATPLKRIGLAEEVASALLYLAAPSGAFTQATSCRPKAASG